MALILALGAGARAAPDPEFQRLEARREAALAVGRVRAEVAARDAVLRRATEAPNPEVCAGLAETTATLDEAWARYLAALANLAALGEPADGPAARSAALIAETERSSDRDLATEWSWFCSALPAVGPHLRVPAAPRTPYCGLLRLGDVLVRPLLRPPGPAIDQLRWLAPRLADELDFLILVVHPSVDPLDAERWSAVFNRGTPGLGEAAPYPPGLLPEWRRLQAAIVISGAEGLRQGPALRGVVHAFGNRWAVPGCSPAVGGGWGYADVGGQLGGGRALVRKADGRWGVAPVRPDGGMGLVGNGGNALPYAPLELYLLGLLPLDAVPPVTFLKAPEVTPDGVTAAGTCRLTPADIRARFGERPRHEGPYTVGVVVLTTTALTPDDVRRYREDAAAFTAPGPDDDPLVFNFHEATDGRGRLVLRVPAGRGCADAAVRLP